MNALPAAQIFPHVDATRADAISDDHVRFFRDQGLLVVRNVLAGDELAALQHQTRPLIDQAVAGSADPDYFYKEHELTGKQVPFRIEYVIDKLPACKALLAHPFILRSIEKLQGRNFVPTWDSMVFKNEGQGASIPWHRDAGIYGAPGIDEAVAAINVDFYLDVADLSNCLWGVPGSNRWTKAQAERRCAQLNGSLNDGAFQREADVAPITMRPGDVIFHSTLVLHGSQPARSALRRVLYYEFRPGEVERAHGPHVPEYIPLKQRVLAACLRQRAAAAYAAGETPFVYRPTAEFTPPPLADDEALTTYRYPHPQFWRAAPAGAEAGP